jgi:DNA helicase-2/ATP-dependent DNA helicase PcrA
MFASAVWSEGLDDEQLAVATHDDRPLVVVAGAGTGKTRALVSRVARLLEQGAPPERVLLLTFTRRAADEMLARAARLVGLGADRGPWGGTFHAVAHRFIASYAELLGFAKGFSVIGPGEACDLMDLMRTEFELNGTTARPPRSATLVEIYSRCINTCRPLHEVLKVDYPWCQPHFVAISELFRAFSARKASCALLDFDDLLLYWRALLCEEVLGRHLAGMFDYVLVDEYQDVNSLQVDIVRLLAPYGRGLSVVGDEAQAVYGFRGADSRQLRELVMGYPGACVIKLEQNFRSRQSILDVANAVRPTGGTAEICLYSERGPGPKPRLVRCHDTSSEARAIVDNIVEAHERGMPLRDQVVLVRAAHHSDLVEVELTARKIPYRKYGGLRFLEAAHVKDFVSAARLLDNPHDEVAWYRVLKLHDNIGLSRARALADIALRSADILGEWQEIVAFAPADVRSSLSLTLERLAEARSVRAPAQRAALVVRALEPLLVGRYPDAAVRLGDLERLAGAAGGVTDLSVWLAELALDPPESTSDLAGPPLLDEDYLVISTIHSAKGLEWAAVHVPHVVDGFIPIDMALSTEEGLEEERRLFYVAITRARDELTLYAPLRMPYHRRGADDRHGYAALSRFLGPAVTAGMEVADEVPVRFAVPAGATIGRISVDLDHLWL